MAQRAVSFLTSAVGLSLGLSDLAAHGPVAARLTGPMIPAGKESVILPMRSGQIVVMAIPRPLPAGTVVNDLAQRVVWSGCDQAHKNWTSHVIVGSMHEVSTLANARDTTEDVVRVAEALASAMPVEAVSWDGSGLFVQSADFIRMAGASPWPPELLIRCEWRRSQEAAPNALMVGTRGLGFFGLPELQDVTCDPDANAIRSRLLNLGSYLIANGPVIRDGDTIGAGEPRPIRVRNGTGPDGSPVLSLHSYNG